MSELGVIGARQSFLQTHAAKRADHLQNVANHLEDISATLAARGKDTAAANVANVAVRVTTRADRIAVAVTQHQPESVPPVTDGDGDAGDLTGKGTLLDVTA